MKLKISFLKKALILLVAIATSILGPKVFAEKANHSAFFTKHYTKTSDLANDIEQGKKYLVHNVTELQFINLQLDNWNTQLAVKRVLDIDGNIFQLEKKFTSTSEAKKYFIDILKNHCLDSQRIWGENDYLLARVNKSTGKITNDWPRENRPGEIVVELVPSSFIDEVNASDGDYPTIPGFSLYCGNDLIPRKVTEPEGKPQFVYKEKEEKREVLERNPNNSAWGDPPKTTTTTTSTASSGGNVTYNTYNTSTTNIENPAPVVVKNNQNGQMFLMLGIMVIGQIVGTKLRIWEMEQQYKMMPQQSINYSPTYLLSQNIPINKPGIVEGFATNDWAKPVQGLANNDWAARSIEGKTTPQVFVNGTSIEGRTDGKTWVLDPIQGWILV